MEAYENGACVKCFIRHGSALNIYASFLSENGACVKCFIRHSPIRITHDFLISNETQPLFRITLGVSRAAGSRLAS